VDEIPRIKNPTPGNAEPQLGSGSKNTSLGWYSRGYLPHCDQLTRFQSITFRLADSLPREALESLEEQLRLESETGRDQKRRKQIEAWLDAGTGCCALRHPAVASLMQETLKKFDGSRYRLIAWCVMPNHLHVLIDPSESLGKIVQSWKSYTGRWILARNAELGLGVPGKECWMREYWDRYIRDENHLRQTILYIHETPVKAGLCRTAADWLDKRKPSHPRERRAPARLIKTINPLSAPAQPRIFFGSTSGRKAVSKPISGK
jgi:putative transposase